MEIHTIGIDLGKTVFHLVGLNAVGETVMRKKCSRKQLLHFTANLHVRLIGTEACCGAHFLGRALREQRHEVRLNWNCSSDILVSQFSGSDFTPMSSIGQRSALTRTRGEFYIDRTRSGATVSADFPVRTTAPLAAGRPYDLRLIVDRVLSRRPCTSPLSNR